MMCPIPKLTFRWWAIPACRLRFRGWNFGHYMHLCDLISHSVCRRIRQLHRIHQAFSTPSDPKQEEKIHNWRSFSVENRYTFNFITTSYIYHNKTEEARQIWTRQVCTEVHPFIPGIQLSSLCYITLLNNSKCSQIYLHEVESGFHTVRSELTWGTFTLDAWRIPELRTLHHLVWFTAAIKFPNAEMATPAPCKAEIQLIKSGITYVLCSQKG